MIRAIVVAAVGAAGLAALLSVVPAGAYPWYVSRAAGLLAFTALTGSMAFGLLISSRSGPRWLSKTATFELHQFLAVLGLVLTGIHAAALVFDTTVPFSPIDVLVPFAAAYRPAWVAAGVTAAWLSALVAGSFWMKGRIGQVAWRRLHFASFGAYALALVHGIGAGSDTTAAPIYWGYVVSGALVTSLLVMRILAARTARRSRAKKARPAAEPRPPSRPVAIPGQGKAGGPAS